MILTEVVPPLFDVGSLYNRARIACVRICAAAVFLCHNLYLPFIFCIWFASLSYQKSHPDFLSTFDRKSGWSPVFWGVLRSIFLFCKLSVFQVKVKSLCDLLLFSLVQIEGVDIL